jgi:uncharacterized protein
VAIAGRDAEALARVAEQVRAAHVAAASSANASAARAGPTPSDADAGPGSASLPRAFTVAGDLRRPGTPAEVVDAAMAALGGLDLVVSNAGVGWAGPFTDMQAAEIDDLVDLNLRAPLQLTRAALPALLASGRGQVVYVGSIAGQLGVAGEVAYSATKAGLVGLADSLRSELAGTGVGVTLITPGVVKTAFFARRNRPYERTRPRPVPAATVADAAIAAIVRGRPEVTVPAWLNLPVRLRGTWPGLYRLLSDRFD